MPFKNTLLSGLLDVEDVGIRIVGILWLLIGLAFAMVGVGIITLLPSHTSHHYIFINHVHSRLA